MQNKTNYLLVLCGFSHNDSGTTYYTSVTHDHILKRVQSQGRF